MDFRQLRYFVRIVECGSLSKAAEVLRVAQPSLSLQLKNLEEELGVRLLVRHPRGVTPTDLGMEFFDYAQRILREVDRAKEVVKSYSNNPFGRVSIGLPTSACRGVCLELFKAVSERLPRVSLDIVEGMSAHLDEWIQTGRLDVALIYNHKAFEHVAWTEMMVEELVLLVPPTSELAHRDQISFRELADLEITLPGRPNVARTLIEHLAARTDTQLHITDCNSLHGMAQLTETGRMCVMPRFAFAEELQEGKLVPVPIVDPTPSWRLSVVLSQRTINMRASEAVARVMADVIYKLVKAGIWAATPTDRALETTV